MISKEVRKYCRPIYHHLIENYDKAIKSPEMWVCHHRKEIDENGRNAFSADDLIDMGEYYHLPPEELIFLSKSEHKALHQAANNKDKSISREQKLERQRERSKKYREQHKEEINQRARDKWKLDEEYRKRKRENHRKWFERHPEKNKERLKQFRLDNPGYYTKYYTKKT